MTAVPAIIERICRSFLKYCGIAGLNAALQRRRSARFTRSHFQHVVKLAAQDGPAIHPKSEDGERTPLFSFVVPVFNTRAQYLEDLLLSFEWQQKRFSELILSDDGSTAEETKRWL